MEASGSLGQSAGKSGQSEEIASNRFRQQDNNELD